MRPDWVSNPEPLAIDSDVLLNGLCSPALRTEWLVYNDNHR